MGRVEHRVHHVPIGVVGPELAEEPQRRVRTPRRRQGGGQLAAQAQI